MDGGKQQRLNRLNRNHNIPPLNKMAAIDCAILVCILSLGSFVPQNKVRAEASGGASDEAGFRGLPDAILREMVDRLADQAGSPLEADQSGSIDYLNSRLKDELEPRVIKELDNDASAYNSLFADYSEGIIPDNPTIRDQEYLQHSALWGHQYVSGGAGEGKQRLRPNGILRNVQEIKTDAVLPAYCNPPNPCPIGHTSEDGCLEQFENTAAFSREYQAAQECMCDSEHMFDCPTQTRDAEINVLAQSIQNEGLVDHTINRIVQDLKVDGEHDKVVAKKHHPQPPFNPYLEGDKLPIVAKKGKK